MVRKVHFLIILLHPKELVARTKIRVQPLTSCKNLYFNPCRKFSVLRFWKEYTVLGSVQYGIYSLPTNHQYNAELPSQNRN